MAATTSTPSATMVSCLVSMRSHPRTRLIVGQGEWFLRDFARRDQDAAELSAPQDLDRNELSDPLFGKESVQIVDAAYRLAGKFHDQIAGPQLCVGGGRAFRHCGDRDAAIVGEVMHADDQPR